MSDLAAAHGWFNPRRPRFRRRRLPGGPVSPGPLTELDQAALHLTTVRAAHAQLVAAAAAGDLPAQHQAAAVIAGGARHLRDALAVVLNERNVLDRPR